MSDEALYSEILITAVKYIRLTNEYSSQKEFGEEIGKTKQAVAAWENGSNFPTPESIDQIIAAVPGLSVKKFLKIMLKFVN